MPNSNGTNSKNIRDNLVSTEYQPLEGTQPPVHIGQERTGFQAVITSPWIMRWASIPATYSSYRTIRKNSTVALARELAVSPIIASDWTIKADEDVPKEWEDYVRDTFMPLRDEFLATALYFGDIDFGYQCWEKVIEPADGYLKLVRLKALLHDITEICIGHKGGFIGVRQVGQNLGLNNSIHCGFRVEGSYLYGIPLLENIRNIYNMWMDCNEGARRYDRKIAGSHIVVEYPPGSSFDRYGKEVENAVLANQILQTLESAGGIAVPRDLAAYMQLLNTQDPGWKIWIMDQGGAQQHSFTDRLDYLDKQFTRGLHIPERAILEGRHGTLAEAEAHGDVIFTIQDIKHRRVTDELNRQAVKQMLYLNFGKEAIKGGHPRVRLVASPIADKQKLLFTQLYTQLLGSPAGAQELQSIDMKSMRDQLGIPTHPIDPGEQTPEQQSQPQLQGIPGVSQGIPGGPGRNMVALDKDGHPVTVDGNQPPQQLAQAMANAIEGMSKAVALSSSTIERLTCASKEEEPEAHIEHEWDGPKHLILSYKDPDGEFAGMDLYASRLQPGYFQAMGVNVDKPARRQGYATKLYEHAHNLLKEAGFNGVISHPENRSNAAEKLWSSFPKKKLGEWDLFDPEGRGLSNMGDTRTLPTQSHNFSESIPELVGQSLDMANEQPEESMKPAVEDPKEHEKLVRKYEYPTEKEWAAAQKIIPPQLLAQIELGIENLNLGKTGLQIVGVPGLYAGDVIGLHVAVVDGDWIKMHQNPDMVEGDNCLHSKGIVPKGWAYVDGNVYKHDRDPIAMHEITETVLEKAGWDYDKAHRSANQFEDERRKKLGIGMANESEVDLELASRPSDTTGYGDHPYNQLFDQKIRDLADRITDPAAKAAAENSIGKPHMGAIAKAVHEAGFKGPDIDQHAANIGENILIGDPSKGSRSLFDSYDESKGATYPTLFRTYVKNGVFGLQRNRKRSSKSQQDTSETSGESPLVNVPERKSGQPTIRQNIKFDPTRSTEHLDYRQPWEEEFVNALKEHVRENVGDLGVKFLDAKLAGKKYKDVDIGEEAPWVRKSLPPKLHEAIRTFANEQDNEHLNWLLDKLNKEKGVNLDNEEDPLELALAGTIGDILAARALACDESEQDVEF